MTAAEGLEFSRRNQRLIAAPAVRSPHCPGIGLTVPKALANRGLTARSRRTATCFKNLPPSPCVFDLCLGSNGVSGCGWKGMETRHKILILDDDADWLDVCRDTLAQLPSKPEVRTVGAGSRAVAQLDSEPFRLLICDLRMPKMDGLQVLMIVRRRFPNLRTVVLTGLEDEEFRSRAYNLGVDLFWLKSDMQLNTKLFLDCLESLLGRDTNGGFRGIQSKSLMDIVQLECLSRSSTVLRITRGPLVARLWIQNGELIDAEVGGARGEPAFRRILAWKSGTFETLPAEPNRERTIVKSVNALLLESAQAMDENANPSQTEFIERAAHEKNVWKISLLASEGAEFIVVVPPGQGKIEAWGTFSGDQLAAWTRHAAEAARRLGEHLEAGPFSHIAASSLERRLILLPHEDKSVLMGWPPETGEGQLLERTKKLSASWDS
jgi:CheY-like chemotaxis protein